MSSVARAKLQTTSDTIVGNPLSGDRDFVTKMEESRIPNSSIDVVIKGRIISQRGTARYLIKIIAFVKDDTLIKLQRMCESKSSVLVFTPLRKLRGETSIRDVECQCVKLPTVLTSYQQRTYHKVAFELEEIITI